MFVLGLLCIGVAVAVLCHDLPIGKRLHALLIDAPARLLAKLTWAKVLVSVALMTFVIGAVFIGFNMHDGVVVFMMLPEVLVWIAAFDIATLLELSLITMFAAASVRFDQVAKLVVARISTLVARTRALTTRAKREHRSKPVRPARPAPDDDSPAPSWGYAFA